ncbi:MAG TPA: TIGR03435 family protein [Terracidiphilus sp.]|nr:TIGR03435 family protein [Terracidiphilus sp.]
MTIGRWLCVCFLVSGSLYEPYVDAQQAPIEPKLPAFEVAAIKLSRPDDNDHGWHGTRDRITIENYTLKRLIRAAYGLKSDTQVIGGPDWTDKQAFDISAKIEDAEVQKMSSMATLDRQRERNEMLQALLADRFQLKVRQEERVMPVYALVQAKGGTKLRPNPTASKSNGSSSDNGHMTATALSMDSFADTLTYFSETGDRVVLNRTGLACEYDFKLNWAEDQGSGVPPDAEFPGLFTALEEQLGLKLESQKGSVPVVIIESAAKPVID